MVSNRSRTAVSRHPKPRLAHARVFNFFNSTVGLAPIDGKQRSGHSVRIGLYVRLDGFKIELAIAAARIFRQAHRQSFGILLRLLKRSTKAALFGSSVLAIAMHPSLSRFAKARSPMAMERPLDRDASLLRSGPTADL